MTSKKGNGQNGQRATARATASAVELRSMPIHAMKPHEWGTRISVGASGGGGVV
jgi:hypothetical protein